MQIDLTKLIRKTLELLPVQKDCADEIEEFIVQRLIIFLNDKYKKNVLESCAASSNPLTDLNDYVERVKVVSTLDNEALLESANRVIRILKEENNNPVNPTLFKEAAEKNLFEKIKTLDENVDYKTYLEQIISINPAVEKFFADVLVMDKDEKVKENRLALLTMLKKCYEHLTDFSKL